MFDFIQFYRVPTFFKFKTARVIKYDLYLEPYGNKISTVTVEGRISIDTPAIAITSSFAFYVEACSPSGTENSSVVSLKPLFTIFDRDIPYTAQSKISTQIVTDVTNQFVNCSDPYFALPYLSIRLAGADENTYQAPKVDDFGRYNLKEYLEDIAENTYVGYSLSGSAISMEVYDRVGSSAFSDSTEIYDTTVSKDVLISAVFTQDLISKVTHHDPEAGTTIDYYLLEDGSISTNVSATGRLQGRWIVYNAANANIGLVAAQFARSRYSHSIELYTKIPQYYRALPDYYGPCKIVLKGIGAVNSRITSVNVRTGLEKVARITAGRALTKLNEIIQEVRNAYN